MFGSRFVVLIVGIVWFVDSVTSAAEPHAAFAIKNGWIECALCRDGKPVTDAVIQVLDEKGQNFAEGETGPDGQTAFPVPAGSSFTVEIKAGSRTADPIRLYKIDGGIEPGRVLLSYGLRACCRTKVLNDVKLAGVETEPAPPPSESQTSWMLWSIALAALLGLGLSGYLARRRCVHSSNSSLKE